MSACSRQYSDYYLDCLLSCWESQEQIDKTLLSVHQKPNYSTQFSLNTGNMGKHLALARIIGIKKDKSSKLQTENNTRH